MAQGNLEGAEINFGPYLGYNSVIQPPLPQYRPQQPQPQLQQQIPTAQRPGRQANNNPLLIGILQTQMHKIMTDWQQNRN